MTLSAPMSSTTDSESRKTRSWIGKCRPNTASAPSTNAVSVAMGIPQACAAGVPAVQA